MSGVTLQAVSHAVMPHPVTIGTADVALGDLLLLHGSDEG